jgi:hypothetical protein
MLGERDERWSERDVVRKLNELEEAEKSNTKNIIEAIKDSMQANARAMQASTDAIVAAIQGSEPPPIIADMLTGTLIPN